MWQQNFKNHCSSIMGWEDYEYSKELVNTCPIHDPLMWLVYSMGLTKHFNAYILEKLPFLMQILELFEAGDSVKGKVLWYENPIHKNFNETKGDILKINYESSSTNSNCVPCNPQPLSQIQVSRSIKTSKNETNNSMKAEVVSYDECCMTCKSSTVTQRVKSLPEIITSGDQLKYPENILEYLTINEESNFFMLVLVTLFISGLGHFISLFCSCSSTWLYYDGLASIKTKMVKRPNILHVEKLGYLMYVSKKCFVYPVNIKWNVLQRKLQ